MSTLDPKPIKAKTMNAKLLPIAAIVLIVLALLFMATPLLSSTRGFQGGRDFTPPANGQGFPNFPGGQNGFPNSGNDTQGQGLPGQGGSNFPARQFGGQGGLLGFGILNGMTGTIVYAIALLVSLAAAIGMFITKRWGQVLGIVMAVIYLLLALVSFVPMVLLSFMRGLNSLSLGQGILHLVLAIAVIVLASIPAKKVLTPALPDNPPVASA